MSKITIANCANHKSRKPAKPSLEGRQSLERTRLVPAAPAAPGGARRDRTDDLLLAKQALSQLSYGPAGGQASGDR